MDMIRALHLAKNDPTDTINIIFDKPRSFKKPEFPNKPNSSLNAEPPVTIRHSVSRLEDPDSAASSSVNLKSLSGNNQFSGNGRTMKPGDEVNFTFPAQKKLTASQQGRLVVGEVARWLHALRLLVVFLMNGAGIFYLLERDKKVEFTPGDLYARKRPLNSEDSSFLPPTISHINKFKSASSGNENNGENEESVSENDRDNIVGVTDRSELEEMEPPSTLLCELHPYQKQALSWMIQLERGHCGDEVTTTMHPCWDAYQLADRYDPWWNPAVEEQAVMRIHRIGQTNKVVVKRLKDTEERMEAVQARKQRMISGALTDQEYQNLREPLLQISRLDSGLLRNIIPSDIINQRKTEHPLFLDLTMAEMMGFVMEWAVGSTTAESMGRLWGTVEATFLARGVRLGLFISLIMSTMLFVEWLYIGFVVAYVKLYKKKPEKRYKWEPIRADPESGNAAFPMVLVQIPIFNEKEVFKLSIGAACKLTWPADSLLIQVIDGSTDTLVKEMVEKECVRWASEGINIRYQSRNTREGFKAGALKEGMEYGYVKECQHVAIFDSDFQPDPDFLQRAVPFLLHNPDLALVQARWRFVNADECLLTRLQEMSLDYHFMAEQEVGSSVHEFFGFNGSGGIWRVAAMKEAGGWDDRTTAEDMDLAIRAAYKAGNFYIELPSTLKAFRSQQYRWFCGPNNLFRKTMMDIARSKKISVWKKIYMIYNFFVVRKIIGHTCIFFSYCIVLPLTIVVAGVDVPKGGAVFVPCIITAINVALSTPRSLHLVVVWVLFECVMSFHLTKAIFTGLLGAKSANEWLVTEKLGDSAMRKKIQSEASANAPKRSLYQLIRSR
ncbi:hypothetical protein SASPL_155963 [Salvia splendens]|uniref:glucomannan 4-beta-mannosyltransferase n=1 Tax=Salvia splendens TaxID=180675 RepID=A0A8X8VXP5_SALSN|nr:hypothetical protein SASPL_155963 [Salvia splendens]